MNNKIGISNYSPTRLFDGHQLNRFTMLLNQFRQLCYENGFSPQKSTLFLNLYVNKYILTKKIFFLNKNFKKP